MLKSKIFVNLLLSLLVNLIMVLPAINLFISRVEAQTLDNALASSANGAKKSKFSGFALAQHYMGFGNTSNEPVTFLFGQLHYQLGKWILFANQSANKVYFIGDSNEPELIAADTQVGILRVYKDILGGGRMQVRSFLTLPVSEVSNRNGLITRPDFRFRNTWSFLDNKMTLSLGAELLGYINRYTTTKTSPTDSGLGAPMPLFRTSLQSLMSYNLSSKLSLSSYIFYIDRRFERFGPATPTSSGQTANHDFWYGLSFNYGFDDNWVGTLSYDHANTIEQNGGVDLFAFDPLSSQWSLGVNYIF